MEYFAHIINIVGIYIILAVSLNLVIGYTGLPAMGQSAFFCVGAYVSALLTLNVGISPWVTIIIAAIASGVIGWLVCLSVARLTGDLLALATFGFAIVTHSIVRNWVEVTRGPMGLPGIPSFSLFGLQLASAWEFFFIVALFCCGTILICNRLIHSPYGRILQGIREAQIVMTSLGRDVSSYKRSVFAVGALFAGIAGALFAHYITFIDPSSFKAWGSFTILLMVVLGGMGSLSGSILGAMIIVLLPELLRFIGLPSSVAAPLRQMLYGTLLVVLMLSRPQGLLGKLKWRL